MKLLASNAQLRQGNTTPNSRADNESLPQKLTTMSLSSEQVSMLDMFLTLALLFLRIHESESDILL